MLQYIQKKHTGYLKNPNALYHFQGGTSMKLIPKKLLTVFLITVLITSGFLQTAKVSAFSFQSIEHIKNYYYSNGQNFSPCSVEFVNTKLWTRYGYKKVFIAIFSTGQASTTDVYYKKKNRYKQIYSWIGFPCMYKNKKYFILNAPDCDAVSFYKFTGTTYQCQTGYEYGSHPEITTKKSNAILKKFHFPGKEKDYHRLKGNFSMLN